MPFNIGGFTYDSTFIQNYTKGGIVTDGLVLHLDAAYANSYPKGGTTWYDLSGNSNHGTLTNGPVYDNTNGGNIVFDGTNDYVDLNTTLSSVISPSLPATWSVWVYVNPSSLNRTIIGSGWNSGGVHMRLTGSSHSPENRIRFLYFTNGSNGTGFDSSTTFNSGWYNFVAVYNGNGLSHSNFSFYSNGINSSVTNPTFGSPTTIPTSQNFSIGRAGTDNTAFYNSSVAQVSIYNRALSATEILQNYNATKNKFTTAPNLPIPFTTDGLQLYLDAGDASSYPGTGTTWYDLSGNNRNFNWTTTPTFTSSTSTSYFATDGKKCTGPASNSFGIDNTSGYTIFLIFKQNSLRTTSSFKFYSSSGYGRGIFAHSTWSDNNIYFDQGGCCNADTRTYVASGGVSGWSIIAFRRLTNSSTRSIHKNGSTLITNTATAANINLTSTGVDLGGNDESTQWDAHLNSFIVYNRGLSDAEIQSVSQVFQTRFGI